jgi:hypothetical protein
VILDQPKRSTQEFDPSAFDQKRSAIALGGRVGSTGMAGRIKDAHPSIVNFSLPIGIVNSNDENIAAGRPGPASLWRD